MDDEVNDDGQENQEEGELKSPEDNVHYKLYLKGREVWNRWARGAFDEEDAKKYGLSKVQPFSEEEAKELAGELGEEELPGYEERIDFEKVNFEQELDFSKFVIKMFVFSIFFPTHQFINEKIPSVPE